MVRSTVPRDCDIGFEVLKNTKYYLASFSSNSKQLDPTSYNFEHGFVPMVQKSYQELGFFMKVFQMFARQSPFTMTEVRDQLADKKKRQVIYGLLMESAGDGRVSEKNFLDVSQYLHPDGQTKKQSMQQ